MNQTIEVSGGEYYFSPQTITVEKGERIRVQFTNQGQVSHNLRIPSLNIGSPAISPGRTDSFTFTAPKTGTFPIRFECTIPGHAERGMTGDVQLKG
ncbi:MAG: cupredoxin domain-containing protein [Candidatus Nanohaloarchaea archaeon]|nr:cupredoxin domain-containing protein [Candidatus Nanohaloarchaea archaeon]